MVKKILVVDDEPSIVKGLKYSLKQEGYDVFSAYDGKKALKLIENESFDLILLDVMLPEMNGLDILKTIRDTSDVPVIMLSAKGDDMDKILGLEYGADDYITKPFNILELKMRIKAVLRRLVSNKENRTKEIITVDSLSINIVNKSVTIDGENINLTAKEFDLLELFATNPEKIFSRERLLEIIWKYDYLGDVRTVDVHIRRLREKIEKEPSKPKYIYTKWGVGYFFTSID